MSTQTPIDIDRMMADIREELSCKFPPEPRSSEGGKLTPDEILARTRVELDRRRRDQPAAVSTSPRESGGAFWRPAAERLPVQPQYILPDLLKYADADFVDIAYRTVLRRPPDSTGFHHHLAMLRSGSASKVEILGELRWSPEGMARSVHIDGLLIPYKLQQWRRKRYVGPVLSWMHSFARLGTLSERQVMLDAAQAHEAQSVGRALNQVSDQFEKHIASLERQLANSPDSASYEALKNNLADTGLRLIATEAELAQTQQVVKAQDARLDSLESQLQTILEREQRQRGDAHALDPLYAQFEDAFRGDRSLVRQRSQPYLGWMQECGAGTVEAPVLDVGCGRGEWLELLRDQGLVGKGIDLNKVFIGACRELDLDVIEGDAISSLRAMPDNSVGAITSMHLVEHLPFEGVIALLDEALRVIRPGGMIVLETPNPENLSVASHTFYFDPTHRNPLPPEALRWIVEARGFQNARVERLSEARELNAPDLLPDTVPGAASINVLLASLGVAPDYAIVARRP